MKDEFDIRGSTRAVGQRLRRHIAVTAAALVSLVPMLPAAANAATASAAVGAGAGRTDAGPVRVEAVVAELVAREQAIVPGQTLKLGLRLVHDEHWHTYWRNPGDSGLPTQLTLDLPPGFQAGEFEWPAPKRLFIPPLANYGYEGEVVLPLSVSVPASIEVEQLRITGKASWLMCSDVCIPGDAQLSLTLPVRRDGANDGQTGTSDPAVAGESVHAPLFAQAAARLPLRKLEAGASVDGATLALKLPADFEQAEYFPYNEGLVDNAAAQALYRMQVADGNKEAATRLDVQLSKSGIAETADSAGVLKAASGVLVSGDDVYVVAPVPTDAIGAAGALLSRVAGADEQPPAARSAASGSALSPSGRSGLSFDGSFGRSESSTLDAAGPRGDATGSGAGGSATADTGAGRTAAPGSSLATLALAAAFAALGGLILNLMPCVFPVIGLKVLGFAGHGGAGLGQDEATRRASRIGALAFAAGVIVSFIVLASLLLALRSAGQAIGWGFQLQSPAFVAAMALLFVAIGLNLSGVWEFGVAMTRLGQYDPATRSTSRLMPGGGDPGTEQERDQSAGVAGSFGAGVLAVLVATPCTAPFMGSAMGFTLSATVAETLTVFGALGLGMALPYLLLGLFPGWLRHLPRPGRWMETFRQVLAFPMYATAAWLGWVLGRQVGIDAVFALAIASVLLGFAAWLYGRFVQRAQPVRVGPAAARRRRALAGAAAFASVIGAIALAWPDDSALRADLDRAMTASPAGAAGSRETDDSAGAAQRWDEHANGWQVWSVAAAQQALAAGRPVFVDFTAAWCVSCQVNKKLVLDRAAVVEAMTSAQIVRMRADWTSRDPEITAELARHGRSGVPLYLLYRPGSPQPAILPELLSAGIVREAIAAVSPATLATPTTGQAVAASVASF